MGGEWGSLWAMARLTCTKACELDGQVGVFFAHAARNSLYVTRVRSQAHTYTFPMSAQPPHSPAPASRLNQELAMTAVFVAGYAGIIVEEGLGLSKAAVALILAAGLWSIRATAAGLEVGRRGKEREGGGRRTGGQEEMKGHLQEAEEERVVIQSHGVWLCACVVLCTA